MTEAELLVREAVTLRMDAVADERVAQLRAYDYRPRQRHARRWPTVGALAAAIGVTAGLLTAALTTGATSAFAGWTSVPQPASPVAVALARGACGGVPAASVVTSEARGPYTAIVYMKAGNPWQCVVKGSQPVMNKGTQYPLKIVIKPAAGRVSLPQFNHSAKGHAGAVAAAASAELTHLDHENPTPLRALSRVQQRLFTAETGSSSIAAASGYVGRGVTGVTFVLRDGLHVKATLGNDWYLAWWPGSIRPSAHYPVAVLITTLAGTTRAHFTITPFNRPARLARYYLPDICGACESRTQISVKPGVAAVITHSYKLFRTPPTPTRDLPRWLQHVIKALPARPVAAANPQLGLEHSQTRVVLLNRTHAVILVPGREGLCTFVADHGGGGGGCQTLHSVGRSIVGEFGSGSGGGYTSEASGVVPDGFSRVIVHFTSGQTRAVAVHDNVFRGIFKQQVSAVSARNAAGRVIH